MPSALVHAFGDTARILGGGSPSESAVVIDGEAASSLERPHGIVASRWRLSPLLADGKLLELSPGVSGRPGILGATGRFVMNNLALMGTGLKSVSPGSNVAV